MSQILQSKSSLKRLCILPEALETIAVSDELIPLSSQGFVDAYQKLDTSKINNIHEFTINQYYRQNFGGLPPS